MATLSVSASLGEGLIRSELLHGMNTLTDKGRHSSATLACAFVFCGHNMGLIIFDELVQLNFADWRMRVSEPDLKREKHSGECVGLESAESGESLMQNR